MSLCLVLGPALSACRAPSRPDAGPEPAQAEDGVWMATPRIASVVPKAAGGALVRGEAAPGARVILSGGDGAAMAAGADSRGLFELHIGAAALGQVLTPEIQIGQSTTPGPQRLLLAGEGGELAALLIDGEPSLRLTPGPALDAVDGDGRGLTASGRAAPGERVAVRAGSDVVHAVTDARGRWIAVVPGVGDISVEIGVGGRAFRYPGPGAPADRAERAGGGWRVTRVLSGAARQTSWFPDENA
ncbi:hypothetical protein [Brevundimonas naejangsanensis]|nr:hypothetical protein [Brevundimonas naejangsanensis]